MNHGLNFFRVGGLIRKQKQTILIIKNWKYSQAYENKISKANYNTIIYNKPEKVNCSVNKKVFFHLLNFFTHIEEKGKLGDWGIIEKNEKWATPPIGNFNRQNGKTEKSKENRGNEKDEKSKENEENGKDENTKENGENGKDEKSKENRGNEKDEQNKENEKGKSKGRLKGRFRWFMSPNGRRRKKKEEETEINEVDKKIKSEEGNVIRKNNNGEETHLKKTVKNNQKQVELQKSKQRYNGRETEIIKINYFKYIKLFPLTKKCKEFLFNVKNKNTYRILAKRMNIEKNKITAILLKYQSKKGKLKENLNEHIYRKAVINVKKKVVTFFTRNNNKSIMDIYYEEQKKYKLRKERLFELQKKIFKNSINAQTGIKRFFKKYGYIGLTTYFLIFLVTFIFSYLCFHYKYISLADLEYVSKKMHLNKYYDEQNLQKKMDSIWGEIIFAYLAAKVSEPIRIIITIIITPYIQKLLKLKKKSRML